MNRPNRGPHVLLWSNALPISRRLLPNFIKCAMRWSRPGPTARWRMKLRRCCRNACANWGGACSAAGPAPSSKVRPARRRRGPASTPKKTAVAKRLRLRPDLRTNLALKTARPSAARFFTATRAQTSRRFASPGTRPCRLWGGGILRARGGARAGTLRRQNQRLADPLGHLQACASLWGLRQKGASGQRVHPHHPDGWQHDPDG
jgi:hypothetical protein